MAITGQSGKLYIQDLKVIHRTEGRAFIHAYPSPIGCGSVLTALILHFGFAHTWTPGESLVISQRQGVVSWDHMRSQQLVLSGKETRKWDSV